MNEQQKRRRERWDTIKTSVEMVHGKEVTFAACSAAWLMTMGTAFRASMEDLGSQCDSEGQPHHRLEEYKKEVRDFLMAYHKELCEFLGVPVEEAIRVSHYFDQLVHDTIEGKG